MRDALGEQLTAADEAIANAEAGIGQFDVQLEAMEAEAETATEHAWRADAALEEARGENDKVKEELTEKMRERSDLMVRENQRILIVNVILTSHRLSNVRSKNTRKGEKTSSPTRRKKLMLKFGV